VKAVLPQTLSDRERQLFEELREIRMGEAVGSRQ
jgi:hypothetical protein